MTLPQLLLIPGLLNDAELWRDQIAALANITRLIVVDITQGESLEELVDTVLVQTEERFAMVGFSLGGIVALEVLKKRADRVTHLGLLNTTMLPDSQARTNHRIQQISIARKANKFHGFGEKLLKTYLAPQNLKNKEMVERVREMTTRLGAEVFIRQNLINRPDNRTLVKSIHCPTLVLGGQHDTLTPPDLHRDMAIDIPNSQLLILPESGHLTPIEQPAEVTNALRNLLTR